MVERYKLIAEVHLFLFQEDKTLLLLRKNTGYEDDKYSVIAGHLDPDEPIKIAMVREAYEEAGIKIQIDNLEMIHVIHRRDVQDRIAFFFTCKTWEGEIINNEPDKCEELKWFSLNQLPENIVSYVRQAFKNYSEKIVYSEYGF